ncbi:unnamed protein product [Rotaria socialis]|uniref:AIG1-type G domain-containing protein n=2 Tax=Rotaria socialis TaxID=392032 RepID=A0A818TLW3_9BILA|nr:unnamed protein product [Rotaria socialis]
MSTASSESKNCEFSIIILGNTGSGKSYLCNALIGHKQFKSGFQVEAVPTETNCAPVMMESNSITMYDTPGLVEAIQQQIDRNQKEITEAFRKCPKSVVLFVWTHTSECVHNDDVIAFKALNDAYNFPVKSLIFVVNNVPQRRPVDYEDAFFTTLSYMLEPMPVSRNDIIFIDSMEPWEKERIQEAREKLLISISCHHAELQKQYVPINLQSGDLEYVRKLLESQRLDAEKDWKAFQKQIQAKQNTTKKHSPIAYLDPEYSFQIILIDISKHLNALSSCILKTLLKLTNYSILIYNDLKFSDFNGLPKKSTLLFISSEFALSMENNKPDYVKAIFILENDQNKVDHRERFATGEDLMCQLADELYRCYKKEANDFLICGNSSMASIKEKQANRIHSELQQVHQEYFSNYITTKVSICTTTTLLWLRSKLQNDADVEKVKNIFQGIISNFFEFDSALKYSDYDNTVVADFQQLLNVKGVYHCWLSDKTNINNYGDLCLQLTCDLIAYYTKLGDDCSAKQDAKTARDMFMKANELCKILGEL